MIDTVVVPILKILIVLNATLVGVTYMVLLERKVIAWAQSRLGPMRVGPYGVLQPVADAIKLMLKEDITPVKADKWVFTAAPIISMVPALIVYAVIPFGPEVNLFGRRVALYITDINVGLLYIVSVASVGVYGIILAGYASNSKYPLLASLRASAQLISYELPLAFAIMGVVILTGTLNLTGVVDWQAAVGMPLAVFQPLGLLIFLIASLAEMGRTPFDIPMAESEVVGGPWVEYSGMRWAIFFLGEYASLFASCALMVVFYLGGWHLPIVAISDPLVGGVVGAIWFMVKTFVLIFAVFWLRGTLPRLRIDQLMDFAWKMMIPFSILNLVLTAAAVVYAQRTTSVPWIGLAYAAAFFFVYLIYISFFLKLTIVVLVINNQITFCNSTKVRKCFSLFRFV